MILLAFLIRTVNLDGQNIWGDEAYSIALGARPLSHILSGGSDTHPPLYHAILHLMIRAAGDGIVAVRFLSVLAGTILVAAVFVLAHRLFDVRSAFLAAGLASTSAFAVYYSQETRMYSAVAAFSALSVYAMLRLNDGGFLAPSNRKWLAIYCIATLAAVYTHYFAFFVLFAQVAFMAWVNRRGLPSLRRLAAVHAMLALAYIPWIVVQTGFLRGQAARRWDALRPASIAAVWGNTLKAFAIGQTLPPAYTWVAYALVMVVAVGAWRCGRASGRRRFVLLYLVVPFLITVAVAPVMPFYEPRFLIVALPAYILLLAYGLRSLQPVFWIPGLLLALAANGVAMWNYNTDARYAKGRYGDMMAYVQANAQPGDVLLLEDSAQGALYDYYAPPDIPARFFPLDYGWDDPRTNDVLEAITAEHPRIWLVMFGNPAGYDPGHRLERWLADHASKAFHGDFVGSSLDLFVQGEAGVLAPMEATFGDVVALRAFGLSGNAAPGGTLLLTLEWQRIAATDTDYTIFSHVVDDGQTVWAQVDSQPLGGAHPTSAWEADEVVTDNFALQLDPAMPPGRYHVQVGWYDLATLQRLPVRGDSAGVRPDRLILASFRIAP